MTAATAAATAMAAATRLTDGSGRAGGGKGGKLFRQLLRAAMRAFGVFPVARADQQFAVLSALHTMKLVDRHRRILFRGNQISR